jgi:hypothetical protein
MIGHAKPTPLLITAAVGFVAMLVGYVLGSVITLRAQSEAQQNQPPIVNKALDLYGHGRLSRERLLRTYTPVVVGLPRMTCVAMKPRRPQAGGEDTMCFDATGRLLFIYNGGA